MNSAQLQAQAILEVREREESGESDQAQKFKEKYFDDLEGFARDCIKWPDKEGVKKKGLVNYQNKAARRLVEDRRFSVRGPHGLGKTTFAAVTILWFALTRDGLDWKIPVLASAWRQLTKYLWPEVHKWARLLKWDVIGRPAFDERRELLTLSLNLKTGSAFALASNDPELIEGAHADHILYVFDESKAIKDGIWDAAEGAMSAGEAYWLAISTPGGTQGRFYAIHSRKKGYDDWGVLHVTLKMAIAAGRVSKEWADKRREQWGEKSAVYQNRVLGNFADSGEDTTITLAMVERAVERWYEIDESGEWGALTAIGGDIGRGGDKTVEAFRHSMAIKEVEYYDEKDLMRVSGRIASKMKAPGNHNVIAVIDVIGLGAGVVDRLREIDGGDLAHRVYSFIAGAKSDMRDKSGELGFADMRSAAHWNLRELLIDNAIALPPDDLLIGDLTASTYKYLSGGKIKVETKDDIKKRLKRSTDAGDAVIQVFMEEYMEPEEDFDDLGGVDDHESRWS
jgi:hypothetical protein